MLRGGFKKTSCGAPEHRRIQRVVEGKIRHLCRSPTKPDEWRQFSVLSSTERRSRKDIAALPHPKGQSRTTTARNLQDNSPDTMQVRVHRIEHSLFLSEALWRMRAGMQDRGLRFVTAPVATRVD